VTDVATRLEDWLNASVSDGEFGGKLDQFTVFVVCAFDEASENERWAATRDTLGSYKDPFTGQLVKALSIGLPVPPVQLSAVNLEKGLNVVALALREKLRSRPKRVPKGFEYERFAAAASASLAVYVTA
jgi:hypothetical protein